MSGRQLGDSGTGPAAANRGANVAPNIPAWARERGIMLHDRGRIPAQVIQQYRAAH